jgi:prepilin-type N-terminal cleavage/methylation domain-containing protein
MSLNINKTQQSGFTIVELLIVVVVIAILAAITIVSYTGITQQANTSAAQSNATTVLKKAELYANSETGYPTTLAALTGAASSEVYALPAGAANLITGADLTAATTALGTTPENKDIIFETCGSAAGVRITYWNFTNSVAATAITAGNVSGTCTVAAT